MIQLLEKALSKVLRRSVVLDQNVPFRYLLRRAITTLFGLARSLLFVRRRLVLGRGAKILAPHLLDLSGGLVRLEEYCLIDCLGTEGVRLGRNFKLGAYSRIVVSGSISDLGKGIFIGDNVGIGEFAYIGGAGGVRIGSDVIVGQYFSVHPENHIFGDPNLPIREQGVSRRGIKVGQGCWIGAKVTLIDGVTIGSNCVIAAGSVVTQNFPNNSVIGGVPAKLLQSRFAREKNNHA